MSPSTEKKLLLATAFSEGLTVLVVEIAGARALAPYFGTSLKVWTAQITATLFFLALGYGAGGRFSRVKGDWKLAATLWAAGLWLALYPFMRDPVLASSARVAGVAAGSFISASLLFGFPLLCMGALSPLLIARLDALSQGAGSAAGALFFTNTLGGLAGGWLTALVIIPSTPLRLALAGAGVFLALWGSIWGLVFKRSKGSALAVPLTALALALIAPRPSFSVTLGGGTPAQVLYRHESGVGLIQVLEIGPYGRSLMIDGITQGGMSMETGTSVYEFTEYLNFLSHRYHPKAKNALCFGLGAGLLAKQLVARGLNVTVVELEPRMESVAREYFGLPSGIRVIAEDGRAWLNRNHEKFDLVFLDAFAGETSPWYLCTREALDKVRESLNPGGRFLVNSVTRSGGSEGLKRLESGALKAFGEALIFVEAQHEGGRSDLVNATVVAGTDLKESDATFPSKVFQRVEARLAEIGGRKRLAVAGGPVMTDDLSDLDAAEGALRLEWRRQVLESLGPGILAD